MLVWARMLDSVRQARVALTAEQEYFKEVREAQDLAGLKFARFNAALRLTYTTRERVIEALTEAGVGTVFTATIEALEAIDPPSQYEQGHQQLVKVQRELARLDDQMGGAVAAGDLVSFSLISGQGAELDSSFVTSLPREFCHGIFLDHPLCPPLEALPGGDYGKQISELLRRFEPRFASAAGVLEFQLALSKEELLSLTRQVAPRMEALVDEVIAELLKLTPLTELRDDHDRLVVHFERIGALVDEIASGAREGDLGQVGLIGPATMAIFCETEKSLTSEEFKAIVAVHIGGGRSGPGDCE